MINTEILLWQDLSKINNIPNNVLFWLDNTKSLTYRLKSQFNDFKIKVLLQEQKKPHLNEIDLLNLNHKFIVREVQLLGNNKVLVFARSIIPINNTTKDLIEIGSKPLGEILFNNKNIKRDKLQVTNAGDIWGRRCVFNIKDSKILVSEFFLKPIYA
jgi:chorismate--pyruvate lyase